MSAPRITYVPHTDATQQGELNALVAAYRFIIDCHAKKEGGPPTAPEKNAKERIKDDFRTGTIIRERP